MAFGQGARPEPTPPTIDELLRAADLQDAAISPDGGRLALLGTAKQAGKDVAYVGISTLLDTGTKPVISPLGDYDVRMVEWGKDDRLLIWVWIWEDERGRKAGIDYYGEFIPIPTKRVISINPKGEDVVLLFGDEPSLLRSTFNAATLVDTLPDDPRRVLMQAWEPRRGVMTLYHVDVYTGEAEPLERGTNLTDAWITQKGVPVLRLDSTVSGSTSMVYGRAPGEKDWKLIKRYRRDAFRKLPEFDVVGETPEPGVLLINTRTDEDPAQVIREFDLRTLTFGNVVAAHKDYDLRSAITTEEGRLLGYSFFDDRLNYEFTDRELGRHFRAIGAYFKNQCNVTVYDISRDQKRLLLHVSGPQDAGSFYTYDMAVTRLEEVGVSRPWLKPERLAPMQALKVTARDGVALSCYLSMPIRKGSEPPPLIVMPHGGPEVRDYLSYDLFVQALAAQGWAVLQPNFRGSGGFGKAFADQGRKRWGDRMQEDVEDAVAHVIASGKVSPNRVAIFGLSYGGYAALMGAVRRPDLYKAVVAGAGDADLFELLNFARREEGANSPTYAYWRDQVGDPKADEAVLKQWSPARRAAEIKAPVLLVHGKEDDVVTPRQSKLMANALKEAGKTYEHIELKGEGHSGWSDENMKLFLEKSVSFIGKYI